MKYRLETQQVFGLIGSGVAYDDNAEWLEHNDKPRGLAAAKAKMEARHANSGFKPPVRVVSVDASGVRTEVCRIESPHKPVIQAAPVTLAKATGLDSDQLKWAINQPWFKEWEYFNDFSDKYVVWAIEEGDKVHPWPFADFEELQRWASAKLGTKVPSNLKPFEHGVWHIWQGTANVMLSNESTKRLREFTTVDGCINWLFLNDYKEAARALNAHAKGSK